MRPFSSLRLILLYIVFLFCACTSVKPPSEIQAALRNDNRPPHATSQGIAILQGLTNAHSTQISIVIPPESSLKIQFTDVSNSKALSDIVEIQHKIPESEVTVRHFLLSKLHLNSTYQLTVLDERGVELDSRFFRTLDIQRVNPRFAAASCMSDQYLENQAEMWAALYSTKPDFLILLGDNNYAAVINKVNRGPLPLPILWNRYAESALKLDLYHFKELIPTVAIWDDFDYGMKDGGLNNPYGREARKAFSAFFAQNTAQDYPEYSKGPGIAALWKAFGINFLLLDNRSFRSESTHFGLEQESWLVKSLKTSQKPFWLISGDQWFGGYHRFESYEGNHNASFKSLLSQIKESKAYVFFLSGDRHLSEVMKIEPDILGYETYEFTSSPMHAKTYPSNWERFPNPRHWKGVAESLNFNLFQIELTDAKRQLRNLKVQAIGIRGKILYEADVPISR
jgi:alkaline phosphatase D